MGYREFIWTNDLSGNDAWAAFLGMSQQQLEIAVAPGEYMLLHRHLSRHRRSAVQMADNPLTSGIQHHLGTTPVSRAGKLVLIQSVLPHCIPFASKLGG